MWGWEIDGHVLIIGLGEQKSSTFYFAYFVVSCKAITDPLLVCLYLVPQMCGFSSSFPSFPLPSCECWFGQSIPDWDPAIVWIEIVIVSRLMWIFIFFSPLSNLGQLVQYVSWSQQLNLLNYTLLSLALSSSLLVWLQSLLERRKTSLAPTWQRALISS